MLRGITTFAASALAVMLATGCGPTSVAGGGDGTDAGPEIRLPPRDNTNFDCQDIPETGLCRDDVAIFCDRRNSSIVEKRCGAQGLSCEVSENLARCVNGNGEEEEVEAEATGGQSTGEECGDVTYEGECDAGVLRFCGTDDKLYEYTCGEGVEVCGYNDNEGYYACLPIGCGDVTTEDKCSEEGDAVIFCSWDYIFEEWYIETWDCLEGYQCELDEMNYGSCVEVETPAEPTCAELGARGACKDATTVHYCLNEQAGIIEIDCAPGSQVCGLTGIGEGYYDCVDP